MNYVILHTKVLRVVYFIERIEVIPTIATNRNSCRSIQITVSSRIFWKSFIWLKIYDFLSKSAHSIYGHHIIRILSIFFLRVYFSQKSHHTTWKFEFIPVDTIYRFITTVPISHKKYLHISSCGKQCTCDTLNIVCFSYKVVMMWRVCVYAHISRWQNALLNAKKD